MKYLRYLMASTMLLCSMGLSAASILIPMDETQKDHLKSYGIAFWVLKNGQEVDWLLNYRGGSFLAKYDTKTESECKIRGVTYEVIADDKVAQITTEINDPSVNMDIVKLEKAPRMAVYSPKEGVKPQDDAVILVLKYAEIPFDLVYDEEVLRGDLNKYDWLHLHHEDFTGQYSKEGNRGRNVDKFLATKAIQEATAKKFGFKKVSKMKLAVAQSIREFCANGGFLLAMCSGADSFDIALAAAKTDIVDEVYDGDGPDPQAQSKLDFSQTLAFQNFNVVTSAYSFGRSGGRFSDIDVSNTRHIYQEDDFFTLFDFSAKWDVVPSMLTQNHDKVIKGFMGLATAFNKSKIKSTVTIMGEMKSANEARYIHGELGKGQWTFYGGHDPENYQYNPNEPPTDLSLHPNSPGYRLILNNVLFPAAKKKKLKT
ncbi:asparagine synthetase B [Mucilaginibacter ximonensis]|uniref:Asparagine synthetase B n=2 Tax=Mucilaginibacter ximonensis TaxID=538021 RepID=A0ABW5Y6H1_9SPHI